jgi:hypothetical protein
MLTPAAFMRYVLVKLKNLTLDPSFPLVSQFGVKEGVCSVAKSCCRGAWLGFGSEANGALGLSTRWSLRGLSGILARFLTIYLGIRYFYKFLVLLHQSRISIPKCRAALAREPRNCETAISILKLKSSLNLKETY